MANDFFDDLVRRDERIRTKQVGNKSYTIRCTDPYGHWHLEGKAVPDSLSGSYTTAERAWMAVEAYELAESQKKPEKSSTKKEV